VYEIKKTVNGRVINNGRGTERTKAEKDALTERVKNKKK